ncbi:SH3 domain-containing protein [Loktanella sp. DJP18]|uniref:SH3 domain-containing protein n=1 Tax=Loktanella sp. DJP18 TaxID=3409788 RepID=UPI003BB4C68A
MGKFIIGSFAILAWTFYVMSGGANFQPETRIADAEAAQPEVTRAQTAGLIDISPTVAPATVAEASATASATESPAQTAEPVAISLETTPAFSGETARSAPVAPNFTSLSAPAPAAVGSPDLAAIREVAGRAVNMREGPSTSFDVIDTLPQGTQTEVIDSDGAGWVRVRVLETGQIGWMAERLLTSG